MALIIRGKRRGETVKLHQWCNDWFVLEDGHFLSPLSLQLDKSEVDKVISSDSGFMLKMFFLNTHTGKFERRRRMIWDCSRKLKKF